MWRNLYYSNKEIGSFKYSWAQGSIQSFDKGILVLSWHHYNLLNGCYSSHHPTHGGPRPLHIHIIIELEEDGDIRALYDWTGIGDVQERNDSASIYSRGSRFIKKVSFAPGGWEASTSSKVLKTLKTHSYYSAMKRNELLTLSTTSMKIRIIMLNGSSQIPFIQILRKCKLLHSDRK